MSVPLAVCWSFNIETVGSYGTLSISWLNTFHMERMLGADIAGRTNEIITDNSLSRDTYVWGKELLVKPKIQQVMHSIYWTDRQVNWTFIKLGRRRAPPAFKGKVLIKKLLVGELAGRFGMTEEYPQCMELSETIEHVLFSCPAAMEAANRWRGWPEHSI